MHRFIVVSYELIMSMLFRLPRYRTLNRLKALFLRARGSRIGKNVEFYPGVWITPGDNMVVGDEVDFSKEVIVTTGGGVTVGDRTMIGFRSQVLSRNHRIPPDRGTMIDSGFDDAPVVIGQDCWIGAFCVILPGVTVGDGSVVAAGSVVTSDVAPFTVVGGTPAKVLRVRPEVGGLVRPDELPGSASV